MANEVDKTQFTPWAGATPDKKLIPLGDILHTVFSEDPPLTFDRLEPCHQKYLIEEHPDVAQYLGCVSVDVQLPAQTEAAPTTATAEV